MAVAAPMIPRAVSHLATAGLEPVTSPFEGRAGLTSAQAGLHAQFASGVLLHGPLASSMPMADLRALLQANVRHISDDSILAACAEVGATLSADGARVVGLAPRHAAGESDMTPNTVRSLMDAFDDA